MLCVAGPRQGSSEALPGEDGCVPAEFLDGADIYDAIVQVIHELWHVFVQELLVSMH